MGYTINRQVNKKTNSIQEETSETQIFLILVLNNQVNRDQLAEIELKSYAMNAYEILSYLLRMLEKTKLTKNEGMEESK